MVWAASPGGSTRTSAQGRLAPASRHTAEGEWAKRMDHRVPGWPGAAGNWAVRKSRSAGARAWGQVGCGFEVGRQGDIGEVALRQGAGGLSGQGRRKPGVGPWDDQGGHGDRGQLSDLREGRVSADGAGGGDRPGPSEGWLRLREIRCRSQHRQMGPQAS